MKTQESQVTRQAESGRQNRAKQLGRECRGAAREPVHPQVEAGGGGRPFKKRSGPAWLGAAPSSGGARHQFAS